MSDREFRDDRSRFLRDMAADMSEERSRMAIGRIAQLTGMSGIPAFDEWIDEPMTTLPSGQMVPVTPTHHLYVYRQDGRAFMILTRLDPFHHEHLSLSELEMQAVMGWAKETANEGIGEFTPADGGWFWWRK